jgi:hypothetical protein
MLAALAVAATLGAGALPGAAGAQPRYVVSCPRPVHTWLSRTSTLDASIHAGMSFASYKSQLTSIQAAYGLVPVNQLSPACVSQVGVPLEKSMNKYIDAYNVWRKCVFAGTCKRPAFDGPMQRFWRDADRYFQTALNNLRV